MEWLFFCVPIFKGPCCATPMLSACLRVDVSQWPVWRGRGRICIPRGALSKPSTPLAGTNVVKKRDAWPGFTRSCATPLSRVRPFRSPFLEGRRGEVRKQSGQQEAQRLTSTHPEEDANRCDFCVLHCNLLFLLVAYSHPQFYGPGVGFKYPPLC